MIQVPRSRALRFLLFFVTQFFSYFIYVANTRATAIGLYWWTGVTDTLFAAQAFIMAKVMVDNKEARDKWAGLGYTIGGTCGSLFSVFITKHFYGR